MTDCMPFGSGTVDRHFLYYRLHLSSLHTIISRPPSLWYSAPSEAFDRSYPRTDIELRTILRNCAVAWMSSLAEAKGASIF